MPFKRDPAKQAASFKKWYEARSSDPKWRAERNRKSRENERRKRWQKLKEERR